MTKISWTLVVAFSVAVLWGVDASAGPFGTEMGADVKNYPDIKEVEPFRYTTTKLPKTHPLFEGYTLKSHPSTGLCLVAGYTRTYGDDRYGSKVRTDFDKLRSQLDEIYGKSRLNDFLQPRALWKEAGEWVMAIAKNERVYQAVWEAKSGQTLKDDVVEILMSVNANGSDASWVHLQYRYKNAKACEAAIEKSAAGAL